MLTRALSVSLSAILPFTVPNLSLAVCDNVADLNLTAYRSVYSVGTPIIRTGFGFISIDPPGSKNPERVYCSQDSSNLALTVSSSDNAITIDSGSSSCLLPPNSELQVDYPFRHANKSQIDKVEFCTGESKQLLTVQYETAGQLSGQNNGHNAISGSLRAIEAPSVSVSFSAEITDGSLNKLHYSVMFSDKVAITRDLVAINAATLPSSTQISFEDVYPLLISSLAEATLIKNS